MSGGCRSKNDAVAKIWDDHLGNNAFVWHRDKCPTCLQAYETQTREWCAEGARIFSRLVEEICAQMDEARENQN